MNVKTGKFIPDDRILRLVAGIASGLQYIHSNDLAHRDLKPQNVLLSDDRQTPVIIDFGSMTERCISVDSAHKSHELQEWAAQNCSLYYKAPELFEPQVGSVVTEAADNWSLGCLVYAMMYNKGPFDYVIEKGIIWR